MHACFHFEKKSMLQLPSSPYYYDAQSGRPRHKHEPGVFLRGLHPLLRAAFFPDYRYASSPPARTGDSSFDDAAVAKPRRNTPRQGRALGRRVDRELTEYFQNGGRVEKWHHPHTANIVEALQRLGYRIIGTQWGVGSRSLRVYHAIDLVLVHKSSSSSSSSSSASTASRRRQGVVLAEVKCCESHYYKKAGQDTQGRKQYLAAPYNDRINSPFHQHQLQMAWSGELWRSTFPDTPVDGHLLVRAHSDGVDVDGMQDWVLERRRAGLDRLVAARREPSIRGYAPVRRRPSTPWRGGRYGRRQGRR